jgi:hypothetical protein
MKIILSNNIINYDNITRVYCDYIKGSNPYYQIVLFDIAGKVHEIKYKDKFTMEKDFKQFL